LAAGAMHSPPALDRECVRQVDETRRGAGNRQGRLTANADISEVMHARIGQG